MLLAPGGKILRENPRARSLLPGPGDYLWERNRSAETFRFLHVLERDGTARAILHTSPPLEIRGVRDGERFWVYLMARPDILLMDNQKRLFSQISHELRTPLANMKMAFELFQSGQMTLEAFEETLARNLQRMEVLVELLSRQRKVEAWMPRFQTRNWCEEVRTILQAFAPRMRAKRLRASFSCDPKLEEAPMDPFLLSTILFPLLDNAVRYNRAGGEIAITLRREGDHAHLTVQDTGRGIPSAILDRVFEPFVQYEGGTGLGLSLVRMAVQRWGGTIHITSREGTGTRVRVHLPLNLESPSPTP